MSCVVYQTNKKTGYVYAYESHSYRDPITKKPKSKRYFLGRVDPVTKQLLDPEHAQKLKEKREKHPDTNSNPSIAESSHDDSLHSSEMDSNIVEELRSIKELLIQQHEDLKKFQQTQEQTRKTLSSVISLVQKNLLS